MEDPQTNSTTTCTSAKWNIQNRTKNRTFTFTPLWQSKGKIFSHTNTTCTKKDLIRWTPPNEEQFHLHTNHPTNDNIKNSYSNTILFTYTRTTHTNTLTFSQKKTQNSGYPQKHKKETTKKTTIHNTQHTKIYTHTKTHTTTHIDTTVVMEHTVNKSNITQNNEGVCWFLRGE